LRSPALRQDFKIYVKNVVEMRRHWQDLRAGSTSSLAAPTTIDAGGPAAQGLKGSVEKRWSRRPHFPERHSPSVRPPFVTSGLRLGAGCDHARFWRRQFKQVGNLVAGAERWRSRWWSAAGRGCDQERVKALTDRFPSISKVIVGCVVPAATVSIRR
jgi:hypothetical protein